MLVTRKCHRCGKKNRFDPEATKRTPRCARCGNRIRRSDPEAVSVVRRVRETLQNYFVFEGKYAVAGLAVVGLVVGGVYLYDKYGPKSLKSSQTPEVAVDPTSPASPKDRPSPIDVSIALRDVSLGFHTLPVDARPVWDEATRQQVPFSSVDANLEIADIPLRFLSIEQTIRGIVGSDHIWTVPDSSEILALSPNGNRVATRPRNASGIEVSVQDRDGDASSIPITSGPGSEIGVVQFLTNDRLLVQVASGVSASVSVWAPGSASAISEFNSSAFRPNTYDISPDGGRIAIAAPSGLKFYDLEKGEVAVTAEAYEIGPAVSSCLGLAYSPMGDQLAAVYPTGRLLVWDTLTGRLILDHGLASPIESAQLGAVQWLPNGRGWLLGGSRLLLADPLVEVWRLPDDQPVAGYNALVVDTGHILLARSGDKPGFIPVRIPWEAIDGTRSTYSNAILKRGRRVQALVTNNGEGQQKDALRLFRKSLEERITRAGFEVANTSDVQFCFDFTEVRGADGAFKDRPYRDGRLRKVSLPVFACTIALRKRGLREPLWIREFATNGGAVPLTTTVSAEYLRGRTLSAVQSRIRNIAIPGYVPDDPSGRLPLIYQPRSPLAGRP